MSRTRVSIGSPQEFLNEENEAGKRARLSDQEKYPAGEIQRMEESERASGAAKRPRVCCDSGERPEGSVDTESTSSSKSPQTTKDSDESFQCRGLKYEPGRRRLDAHQNSDGSFQCRGMQHQPELFGHDSSEESFRCRGLSVEGQSVLSGTNLCAQESDTRVSAEESFQCRSLSNTMQDQPVLSRPEPRPQASNSWASIRGNTKPRKNKNFLGLTLDLRAISNFKIEDRHRGAIQPEVPRNPRLEVAAPVPPIVSSPSSPSYFIETGVSRAGIPMLGSSRLRTLKLERKNKGRLEGIKKVFKKLMRISKIK
ncbi:hypothetical protein PTTG_12683 [Puccinia triticina 1-1 BBBD Race 1]|uniref:Uncharacterized protein n=2 Tax=Puccinia triticina TaxID=208348 RepID=A0A180G925_PUCT1|nr:uncharacterized protein PtA15_4A12 [Puccinia triticina]OAV89187.1 hypothetical protein PTTG_12683 [Puccinia triticina 1-1 BBBD Race 1]WAQ83564.1 hypothetical protein PtA15_4A12 [Puccinia triticina]WAR54396.1 hypothetical protein PtB15_4B13 [Puccinia triticina]